MRTLFPRRWHPCAPRSIQILRSPSTAILRYQLYQQVLGPIEDIISQKKRLSFVLDGALTSLPPQVLIASDPEGKNLRFA